MLFPTDDAKDYQATYVYRAIPLTISGLQLQTLNYRGYWNRAHDNIFQSQAMLVTLLSEYSYQGITMYYPVSNRNLKPDEIINAQNYSYSDVYGINLWEVSVDRYFHCRFS